MITATTTDRICTITLDRAEKRNAFNGQLIAELTDAFTAADRNDVRAIILKGNGKAFSAGADLDYLQQLQSNTYEENLADSSKLADLFRIIYTHSKPVIGQVEGPAIAGGCGLATVCDLVYAVPEAKFGYTEVKIGFIPAVVMIFLLRKIGEARTKELLLTGNLIDAPTALNMGMINGVVESKDINDHVTKIAARLASNTAGSSVAATKEMIATIPTKSVDDALQYAAEMNARMRGSDECLKGIAAFLNKEKIEW